MLTPEERNVRNMIKEMLQSANEGVPEKKIDDMAAIYAAWSKHQFLQTNPDLAGYVQDRDLFAKRKQAIFEGLAKWLKVAKNKKMLMKADLEQMKTDLDAAREHNQKEMKERKAKEAKVTKVTKATKVSRAQPPAKKPASMARWYNDTTTPMMRNDSDDSDQYSEAYLGDDYDSEDGDEFVSDDDFASGY